MIRLEVKNGHMILTKKLQKISALTSDKIDKYHCLRCEEILPSDQSRTIQQAKFTYSPLGKAVEKQIKNFEDQREKQIKATENGVKNNFQTHKKSIVLLLSKKILNEEATYELNKIVKMESKLKDDLT